MNTAVDTALLSLESFQAAFGRSAVVGAVLGGAAIAVAPAQAQETSPAAVSTLEAITVTAPESADNYQTPAAAGSPKFTAPLLDTPKSVTIITEELMQDRGATSLQDVLRTTPGITLGAGEGGTPNGDRPFIRGYEASTDIFIDGVRDYARGSHETFNLEAVEVIKGPSAAYTGRGGTGGSINLQTKKPRLERFVEASAGVGNAHQWRVTADGNFAFSETGAVRLNLMKMGGDVPGRDGVTVDRLGIAPSVAFGLGTPTRVILSYAHVRNDDMPDQGIPFSNAANPGRTTPPKVDRNNFYGRLNTDFRENHFDTGTALLEHDFSEHLKVRNITRYAESLNHYLLTRPTFDNCAAGDGPPCSNEAADAQFQRTSRAWWRSSKSLINQTDAYGTFQTGPIQHTYSAGLEFGRERIYSKTMTGTPANDTDSLYHPDPHRHYTYNLVYGEKTPAGEIRTSAVYFMDTMELTEQWFVNLGLRHDVFKVENASASRKDRFWNYQAGLVYKPLPYGSVYISYATSSNPSGENLGQGGGADGPAGGAQIRDLEPERSRSWELGTKWDLLNDRLSLTGALFETRKTAARSTDPLTGDVSLSGSNRVRGVEVGAAGSLTPRWNLWAGYTYLDPKVTAYRSGNNVFDGNQIKFIAKQSATLWTTYQVLPELMVGGGITYLGKRFANDANTLVLPSYVRYDAMAKYAFNQRFSVQLNINNISDTELYDASHVGLFASVGAGRSYMLTATYRFD
ncbi:MAG: TonB-dependent siderophore receptor [Pigmentiphaga sp.]|nr:TonB-dependent siderophore receptor [Pigmentiphaga sp.]